MNLGVSITEDSLTRLNELSSSIFTINSEEASVENRIANLDKEIESEEEKFQIYAKQQMHGAGMSAGFRLNTLGPQSAYLRRSKLLIKERDVLIATASFLKDRKITLINELVGFYSQIFNTPNEDLPYNALISIGEIAKRSGENEVAGNFFYMASLKTNDPAEKLDLEILCRTLGKEIDLSNSKNRLNNLYSTNHPRANEVSAHLAFVNHRHEAMLNPEHDAVFEQNILRGVDTAIARTQNSETVSSVEISRWLMGLKSIIRDKTSVFGTLSDKEKIELKEQIDNIQVKALELSFKHLSFDEASNAFYPESDNPESIKIYEDLAILYAESVFYFEMLNWRSSSAIKRFHAEVKKLFPASNSIVVFENSICNRMNGLCYNEEFSETDQKNADSAFRTAVGLMDDKDLLSEIGFTAGSGVLGGVGALGVCALLGVPAGPIGSGLTLSGCTALGVTGGSILGYSGRRAYNIYQARDKIAESYESGFSPITFDSAMTRVGLMPIEIGMLAFAGTGIAIRSSVSIPVRATTGAVTRILPEGFLSRIAVSTASNTKTFSNIVGTNYLKFINSKPVLGISGAAVATDLVLDRDYNFGWDGLSHWWGFVPATMVLGNRVFPRLIGVSETGNAVGCALGTGFQVYFQHDAGRDFEYFDWNRAYAGYMFMLASSFTGRTVLDGTKYWEQSIVGRAHLKAFKFLDDKVAKPILGETVFLERTFGRSITYGLQPGELSKNVIGWNGSNPILSWRGRVKLSTYNTALMGGFNFLTAKLQGVDPDRSTAVRVGKMWIWNMLFGPLQAQYGFDKPAGFLIGKPTGEAITWGFNLMFNMFGKQALHEKPTKVWLDSRRPDHFERMTDDEKKIQILEMIRRGTSARGINNPIDRKLMKETIQRFVEFVSKLDDEEKNNLANLLTSFGIDAVEGKLNKDQMRTVQMMAISLLIDMSPDETRQIVVGDKTVSVSIPIVVDYDSLAEELNNGLYDDVFSLAPSGQIQIPSVEAPQIQ